MRGCYLCSLTVRSVCTQILICQMYALHNTKCRRNGHMTNLSLQSYFPSWRKAWHAHTWGSIKLQIICVSLYEVVSHVKTAIYAIIIIIIINSSSNTQEAKYMTYTLFHCVLLEQRGKHSEIKRTIPCNLCNKSLYLV